MTVKKLMDTLKELVEYCGEDIKDKEIVIAEYQNYGSNWAYKIDDVDEGIYSDFDKNNYNKDNDNPNCVRIIMGGQIGTMQDNLW